MKCQLNMLFSIVFYLLCLQQVFSEPPKAKQHPQPLIFKNWPPNRHSAQIRNNGLKFHLRGAGSSNIVSRVPAPGMFIKSGAPIRFAIPMRGDRPVKASLLSSPSSHAFFKVGAPQNAAFKRPYAAHLSSPGVFKFSSPSQKTAIKFQAAPPVPLKSKPEYIYEKVNVPKYPDPVKFNIGSDGAIHTIPAPNLGLKDGAPIPELTANNLNTQLDSDLTKFSGQTFALTLEKPAHQYQVKENYNDLTYKNPFTGQNQYYAPDSDPSLKTHQLRPIDDPLSVPSDGKPKPADVLYHQNLDFAASPLIQGPQYAIDPFAFPVTSQPQLQQYHLQQNTMLKQGMPLASLNPTYLVMQSNNLFGQHQQHLQSHLFRPENGYIDTSVTAQPHVTFNSFDYTNPQQVASLGQIYSAQQDQLHQYHDAISSTQAPTTLPFNHESASTQGNPAYTHLQLEPKPNHYQYSQQNFIDLPDEHLSQNDIQNLLSYNNDYYQDYISQRQLQNDVILREAQEQLQEKLHSQQQQQQTAYDLHQLVQQEKFNPLRIVVPDDDQFKKRIDDGDVSYEDDESEYEEDQESNETQDNKSEESEKKKSS